MAVISAKLRRTIEQGKVDGRKLIHALSLQGRKSGLETGLILLLSEAQGDDRYMQAVVSGYAYSDYMCHKHYQDEDTEMFNLFLERRNLYCQAMAELR